MSDEILVFMDDEAESTVRQESWPILIVDDEPKIHSVTKLVLRDVVIDGRKLEFYSAYSAQQAKEFLQSNPAKIALIFLDVVMEEEDSGLKLVHYIRRELNNQLVRIILRTGQPGYAPESKVVLEYDINDYKEKTELTSQRLVTALVLALRSYRDLETIEENKRGLEQMIEAAPDVFRAQTLEAFAAAALGQLDGLLGLQAAKSFFAMRQENGTSPKIWAATGAFEVMRGQSVADAASADVVSRVQNALQEGRSCYQEDYLLLHRPGSNGAATCLIYLEALERLKRIDGKLLDIFCLHISAAFDKLNLRDEMDATLREMARREEAERALQEKNEELQTALSSLRQAQMQLVQQEKMAGIGQLAAGVAHEINNPLGFIGSNLGCLEQYVGQWQALWQRYGALKEAARSAAAELGEAADAIDALETRQQTALTLTDSLELLQESRDGLERIRRIIVGLRSFSRPSGEETWADYDLNQGLQTVLMLIGSEAQNCADFEVEEGTALVRGVKTQLEQVLMNIVLNALQAIREKGGAERGLIRIRTWQEADFVCCSISDNGAGLDKEKSGRVFEAFFTTRPVGKGVGLGLSIAYDVIVNKHHGKITFDSEAGQGTSVSFCLPQNQKE
ncbi:DUF3369 domain-containing protein [Azotosporobacter soli]|uniref:DUF3369 domain-containing protein n=1 Tax=Azotosporobacter soli TaxID=3055040 RepID=UPI0031FED0F4